MRRATITICDELEAQLDSWMREQDVAPLTAVVQSALKEFLALRGHASASRKLRITPCKKGSGLWDISVAHDRYLADR